MSNDQNPTLKICFKPVRLKLITWWYYRSWRNFTRLIESMADVQLKQRGYIWAIAAGLNAALAAISAKLFSSLVRCFCFFQFNSFCWVLNQLLKKSFDLWQVIKYGLVVICNVVMWACYVNSLRALSSLQATVTNFAANFLSSGLAGLFLFQESLSFRVSYDLELCFMLCFVGYIVYSL